MNKVKAIQHIYPNAVNGVDFSVRDDGDGQYISEWNLINPKPTEDQLQTAWSEYQANPPIPVPTEMEQVKKQIADLGFELMMKGVL